MDQVRPFSRVQRFVATTMLAFGVVFLLAASTMSLLTLGHPIPVTYGTQVGLVVWSVGYCAYSVVGWLIVRRKPENRIGWLFLWVGAIAGFHLAAVTYSSLATRVFEGLPFGHEAMWVGNWGWVGWIGVIVTLIAPLFPHGRPVSRRLWPLIALIVVGLIAGAVGAALAPGPLEVDPRIDNPFGSDSALVGALGAGNLALPVGVLLGVVSLIIRYRRGDAVTRLQLRWFVLSLAIVGAGFVTVFAAPFGDADALARRIFEDAVNTGWAFVAIAVGVAVLRFRLYAVDTVINRALVYGSLTALIAGVYLLSVVGLQTVLRPVAGRGELAIAGSTLVVAALFRPARRRIQSLIDRRFYRARYDASRLVESFSSRMRGELDPDGVASELEAVVRTAVHPVSASVWLRPR